MVMISTSSIILRHGFDECFDGNFFYPSILRVFLLFSDSVNWRWSFYRRYFPFFRTGNLNGVHVKGFIAKLAVHKRL